jgi:hypothetical protein
MSENRVKEVLSKFPTGLMRELPQSDLELLKKLTDDEILRESGSLDMFALIESNRRLKNALQAEESAIRDLTWWLVVLTFILVILTGILAWPELKNLFS